MDSTHTALMYMLDIVEAASVAHVFPDMAKHSLLSVSQLSNEGYYVTFKIYVVTIFNSESNVIMKGRMGLYTVLWRINLRPNKQQTQISEYNNLYVLNNTRVLVNYLHKSLFVPTKSALIKSIKKCHFITFPGLT